MLHIALNTFREILRNKLVSLVVLLSIGLILLAGGLKTLSLGETSRMLLDFGLSFIELSGVLIILLIGSELLSREMSDRTIYMLLAKPINRAHIILGKWLGLSMALLLVLCIESFVLVLLLWIEGGVLPSLFFPALVGIFLTWLLLGAIILFFSIFVSPLVSVFATIALYFIGQSAFMILDFATQKGDSFYSLLGTLIAGIFPNFTSLNIKVLVGSHFQDVGNISLSFTIGVLYLIFFLFLLLFVFERKRYEQV